MSPCAATPHGKKIPIAQQGASHCEHTVLKVTIFGHLTRYDRSSNLPEYETGWPRPKANLLGAFWR